MTTTEADVRPIRSLIPARLDRLGWSPFHTRMVCGLGGAWILDGLQITVASSVSGELAKSSALGMTSEQDRRQVAMPEGMNVEFSHKLSEQEERERRNV
jgi:hypothetical protein